MRLILSKLDALISETDLTPWTPRKPGGDSETDLTPRRNTSYGRSPNVMSDPDAHTAANIRADLVQISNNAKIISSMINDGDTLPDWVTRYINSANNDLRSIVDSNEDSSENKDQ